ncbi:helix-turn-helix transcriptional regulator [Actinomadura chibensis]|uniref:Helix-turn-helix transcriptional regulator n=1 Tax=Actinomadura chibensis TaxID=392828 RepID=A0A5D0NZN2_9ACTN|nr:helix-turn-helix transcriptional regulator [Actinomadura chibensis]
MSSVPPARAPRGAGPPSRPVPPAEGKPAGAPPSFGTALTRWREHRGMSKKKLAAAMGYDPSYVSHVEAGRH